MNVKIGVHTDENGSRKYELLEPLTIIWRFGDEPGDLLDIYVPQGFMSDGASVPRFLWSLVSPPLYPSTIRAAIVHDWLYSKGIESHLTRADADAVFLDTMLNDGHPLLQSVLAYIGVRLFGWARWNRNKEI